jgi:hypothetical protein
LLLVILGTGDLGVILLNNGCWEVEKSCAGISNALDLGTSIGSSANRVASSVKGPVAGRSADRGVCDLAGVSS